MPYLISFIVVAVICVIAILLCRTYINRTFNRIDETLDSILSKKPLAPLARLGDNRISKLQHKVYRIMDMYVSDAALSQNEKETIQGFISDMSHQMKTPLSGILMYSELLLREDISKSDKKDFAVRTQDLSQKLEWLMDCLIKMSRLEAGAIELAPKMCALRQTMVTAVESVISSAAKKKINISFDDFADIELYHDPKWTAEVITNVLENAVKYSPINSEITITIEPLSLYTRLVITDNGIGIEKEDFNNIFKRFYRGKNAKNNEGAGLGLYLATLIMEKQGGYIMVDSIVDHSTSFSLFLQNCGKASYKAVIS